MHNWSVKMPNDAAHHNMNLRITFRLLLLLSFLRLLFTYGFPVCAFLNSFVISDFYSVLIFVFHICLPVFPYFIIFFVFLFICSLFMFRLTIYYFFLFFIVSHFPVNSWSYFFLSLFSFSISYSNLSSSSSLDHPINMLSCQFLT
jgi:hypothetical protein